MSNFDALFAMVDADKNGQVDFVEFVSFLHVCGTEIDAARETGVGTAFVLAKSPSATSLL